jgi:hypothetical protein
MAGFEIEVAESVWTKFPPRDPDDLALYDAVRGNRRFQATA